jgi:methylated-DNA-[protein]-cysteine S-methyltransferase
MAVYPVYAVFVTEAGWMAVSFSEKGLKSLTLPQPTAAQARKLLGAETAENPDLIKDTISRLKEYFSGRKTAFPEVCDLSEATPFQRRVWYITRKIPYGETRSYKWVGSRLGQENATRAVGQALARNPIPIIIPCHRVLASNGSLGGYSGGLKLKRFLLKLEARKRFT